MLSGSSMNYMRIGRRFIRPVLHRTSIGSPRASSRRGHKMVWNIVRVLVSAIILVAVAELSKRQPRLGAILLTLPLISILAFTMSWFEHRDLAVISKLAKETLVLVPLTLPFFVPLAFADRLQFGFWPAMLGGILLASLAVGLWVVFGPNTQA